VIATVEQLPNDGTVAVLKRFADPAQKDVIFVRRGQNKHALAFALAALRHDRFTTPNPAHDLVLALHGAQTNSASIPQAGSDGRKNGATMDPNLRGLDARAAISVRELSDAFNDAP
jgi:hypothetical protein